MPTLALSARYTPDSIALRAAALAAGWKVERLRAWRPSPTLEAADQVVLYAEPLFVACVAEALDLALLEPPFEWLTTLPQRYLQREVTFQPLAALADRGAARFLKPGDDKCFPARVYAADEVIPGLDLLPAGTPTLTAEPVRFEVEYRAFVLDRVARTLSPYGRDGALAQAEAGGWPAPADEAAEAAAFLEALLADPAVALPPAVVVDVGRIEGRGWAVVEANPAFGSGVYGCDPAEVLPVVARACRPARALTDADRAWVVERAAT